MLRQLVASKSQGSRLTNLVWKVGSGLALIRLSSLWFLLYAEWTHQQSLGSLLLVLLLLPEGWVIPKDFSWTWMPAVIFSGLLVLGSFIWALSLILAVNMAKKVLRRS